MNLTYKNHKKHKEYSNGRSEQERTKEFNFSLDLTTILQILVVILDYLRLLFPF